MPEYPNYEDYYQLILELEQLSKKEQIKKLQSIKEENMTHFTYLMTFIEYANYLYKTYYSQIIKYDYDLKDLAKELNLLSIYKHNLKLTDSNKIQEEYEKPIETGDIKSLIHNTFLFSKLDKFNKFLAYQLPIPKKLEFIIVFNEQEKNDLENIYNSSVCIEEIEKSIQKIKENLKTKLISEEAFIALLESYSKNITEKVIVTSITKSSNNSMLFYNIYQEVIKASHENIVEDKVISPLISNINSVEPKYYHKIIKIIFIYLSSFLITKEELKDQEQQTININSQLVEHINTHIENLTNLNYIDRIEYMKKISEYNPKTYEMIINHFISNYKSMASFYANEEYADTLSSTKSYLNELSFKSLAIKLYGDIFIDEITPTQKNKRPVFPLGVTRKPYPIEVIKSNLAILLELIEKNIFYKNLSDYQKYKILFSNRYNKNFNYTNFNELLGLHFKFMNNDPIKMFADELIELIEINTTKEMSYQILENDIHLTASNIFEEMQFQKELNHNLYINNIASLLNELDNINNSNLFEQPKHYTKEMVLQDLSKLRELIIINIVYRLNLSKKVTDKNKRELSKE